MNDLPARYGTDGYGPPPSPEVAKIRDEFFGDKPRPIDAVVEKSQEEHPGRSF